MPSQRHIVVVGAGPAGLLAAGEAAGRRARVTLLEKMRHPGRKLRISGKGRCNLTNTAELPEFIGHFGENGRFLRQAFARFFSKELIAFFESLGVAVKVERGGRVFPAGDDATEVVDALIAWVQRQGVEVRPTAPVASLNISARAVQGVTLEDGTTIPADAVILTTGGKSYPATGSTGDGYRLAGKVGHTVVPPRPALVPLETTGPTAPRLQGLSLKNVEASLHIEGRRTAREFGEMLFTHYGLSGPIILTLSRQAVDALADGKSVSISIDLKPALDEQKLDARLQREISAHGQRQYSSLLKELLPAKMIPVFSDICETSSEKPLNQITVAERRRLRDTLKRLEFEVVGHRGFNEAIVTAGGVNLSEVNPRTMESRLVNGLFIAGELLDLDGDTGGYNLQAAFSTGWLAGRSAAGGN